MPRKLVPDMWLFGMVVALVSVGVVMVYSSSAIVASDKFGDPYFFLKKQLFWAVLGFGCLWGAMAVDYHHLRGAVVPLLTLSIVLLVLVLIPPFGQEINGTRRWFRWGPISFQPAELAKFSLVLYLASFFDRKREIVETFWFGFLPPLLVSGAMAGLVLLQPDLGNSLTLLAMAFCLLFLAGGRVKQMGLVALSALPLIAIVIFMAPYRWRRIEAFLDPWADPRGSGFQIIQSYLALGGGGPFGRGLGESKQKLFYLPESHTDFIFAIVGEELGFVGAAAVVCLFACFVWRGLKIGLRAPDSFGAYMALGFTALLATQTLVNLGVVTGTLPTKGLPLPFLSFGGSALIMAMLSTGILLNISQHATDA
jgi:cell division protein FtsW